MAALFDDDGNARKPKRRKRGRKARAAEAAAADPDPFGPAMPTDAERKAAETLEDGTPLTTSEGPITREMLDDSARVALAEAQRTAEAEAAKQPTPPPEVDPDDAKRRPTSPNPPKPKRNEANQAAESIRPTEAPKPSGLQWTFPDGERDPLEIPDDQARLLGFGDPIGDGQHRLAEAEYFELNALSRSDFEMSTRGEAATPLHILARLKGEITRDQTEPLRLGAATHKAILEGWQVDRIVIRETCAATKKGDGQPCENAGALYDPESGAWFCKTRGHAPKGTPEGPPEAIDRSQFEAINLAATRCAAMPYRPFLMGPNRTETVIVWTEVRESRIVVQGEAGPRAMSVRYPMRFKARLDFLGEATADFPARIVDVKTMGVGEGAPHLRQWKIRDYGWDRQAAHYVRAAQSLIGADQPIAFAWLFVEKSAPFDSLLAAIDEISLRKGRSDLDARFARWVAAVFTGEFPGVAYGPGSQWGKGADLVCGLPERDLERYQNDHGIFA